MLCPCCKQPLKASSEPFEKFWNIYPRKIGKPAALKSYIALKWNDSQQIIDGTNIWCMYWKANKTEKRYIPHPSTFLNQRRFEDIPEGFEKKEEKKPIKPRYKVKEVDVYKEFEKNPEKFDAGINWLKARGFKVPPSFEKKK